MPCKACVACAFEELEDWEEVRRWDSSRRRCSARSFFRLSASVAPGSEASPGMVETAFESEVVGRDLGILED